MLPMLLDHLVYGGPDLAAAVALLAELTGVEAAPGGRHLGEGTANHLIGLGPRAYLEVIGPDPLADDPPGPRWFGLDGLPAPRLLTWAMRPADLDQTVRSSLARGYDPGPARAMSRRTDEGTDLSWRLTPETVGTSGGVVPFLIDWGGTRHPSSRPLPQLELLSLTASHPAPDQVQPSLYALGTDLRVEAAAVGMLAVLAGPLGEVVLT